MKKQKRQLLILLILLVLCVVAYFGVTRLAKGADTEDDGPNAYMGSVTEDVTEEVTETD
jgi:lipopolysaccharide export system protein LptC